MNLSWKDIKPSNQVYWIRIIFALLAALICSPFVLNLNGLFGAFMGWIIYAASYYFMKSVLKIDVQAIGGSRKLISIGIGSYIMVWILVWTVLNTLILFA